ncbi:MAG: hypothetical protein LBH31_02700 [Burkholderiaceae bacterium]|jgi:hypothetical protein|nr:hypothetical protein [Burkholderiaceae bacterium]
MAKKYYSTRTGKNPNAGKIDLATLRKLFSALYIELEEDGYFQEYFGYWCVDNGDVAGSLGPDIDAVILFKIRKSGLWPIREKIDNYSENDLFDVIEFLHDHSSKPIDGFHHTFANCGYHYHTFNQEAGRVYYRMKVRPLLEEYKNGYELSSEGEILEHAPVGMDPLLSANVPTTDKGISDRIASAIAKFRRYRSSVHDRKDAIRDLTDVLEYLRPSLKNVLKKQDESDLFNIANNFGIRHHNQQQKTEYDQAIWLSWMFYFYLATIQAVLHMVKRGQPA